jgi:hypothetical protein
MYNICANKVTYFYLRIFTYVFLRSFIFETKVLGLDSFINGYECLS